MEEVEPIAIIGLSFKFPQDCVSTDSFWETMQRKRTASSEIPADRMMVDSFYHEAEQRVDTIPLKGGHFLKEPLGGFDAPFFSINPSEAMAMDPQQRGMLEGAYHAFENAGIPLSTVAGSNTAVFTGSFSDDHKILSLKDPERLSRYAGSGTSFSILANRLSWWFDLLGPSMNIDTACSSSLVALHLACKSLRDGECTMALVGGSNVLSSLEQYLLMSNLGLLSPYSQSYSFDYRANGYARGEGYGMVVIKTLSSALAGGDCIRAIIRATGVNQDGKTPSLTSPSQTAQERLIQETYRKAGLNISLTAFAEAHGTGTQMGDAIEANALGRVFGAQRPNGHPLYIGAVKANIGHLEGGSGIAGLIKTVLVLERAIIPPNANFEKPNAGIDMAALNITFPLAPTLWPTNGLRRASVNSFGFGGTNAHVVLDDACNYLRNKGMRGHHNSVDLQKKNGNNGFHSSKCGSPVLLVWSGMDNAATARILSQYAKLVSSIPSFSDSPSNLANLAYTLAARRTSLPSSSFAVVDSPHDLSRLPDYASNPERGRRNGNLLYIFTGQGAQYAEMGKGLLPWPVFRRSLDRSNEILQGMGCTWTIIDELLRPAPESKINNAEISQPICTALQIALIDLLNDIGVVPGRVVGHSSGEIAAAYCCGALSAESALRAAFFRGRATALLTAASASQGAMLAMGLSEMEAKVYLDRVRKQNPSWYLILACINSPTSVTASGDAPAIWALQEVLESESIFARRLQVSVAYHSSHVSRISARYLNAMGELHSGHFTGEVPPVMVSSVTGQVVHPIELLKPEYWVHNMELPVQFMEAIHRALDLSAENFQDVVELGPHSALRGALRDTVSAMKRKIQFCYVPILERKLEADRTFLTAAGRLYCSGYPISVLRANHLQRCSQDPVTVLANLPEYPFDHSKSYGGIPRDLDGYQFRHSPRLDLLGAPMIMNGPPQMGRRWRKLTKVSETPWVCDHVVNGATIYPAAGMIAMAIEAINQLRDPEKDVSAFIIPEAEFLRPIEINDTKPTESQLELRIVTDSYVDALSAEFTICTLEGDFWKENCRGSVRIQYQHKDGPELPLPQNHPTVHCCRPVITESLYSTFRNSGLAFGPSFQSLSNVKVGESTMASAHVEVFQWRPHEMSHPQRHIIHPVTLDGVFQTCLAAMTQGGMKVIPTAVPTKLFNLWICGTGAAFPSTSTLLASAKVENQSSHNCTASATATTRNSETMIWLSALETTFVDSILSDNVETPTNSCYGIDWELDIELNRQSVLLNSLTLAGSTCNTSLFEEIRYAFVASSRSALETVDISKAKVMQPHLRLYLNWLRGFVKDTLDHFHMSDHADPRLPPSLVQAAQASTWGKAVVHTGEQLPGLLKGTQDSLQMLFESELAKDIYAEINQRTRPVVERLAGLIAFKNPGLKVLEIGAGTGATTEHILQYTVARTIGGSGISAISSYEFTDLSPAFFGPAKERFRDHLPKMNFSVLDISMDPISQGFKEHSYDLIVAANVLHATENLNTTLQNVRKLLRRGGKLLLIEITHNSWLPQAIFGTLPGWWLSQDNYRELGPCISADKWHQALSKNGFTGADVSLPDCDGPQLRICSVILSTALAGEISPAMFPQIGIIIDDDSSQEVHTASFLRDQLKHLSHAPINVMGLGEAALLNLSGMFCISLMELYTSPLASLSEASFLALRTVLSKAEGILWVRDIGETTPERHLSDGLLRVLRSENPHSTYMSCSVSAGTSPHDVANAGVRLIEKLASSPRDQIEPEYRYVDGCFLINRLVPSPSLDNHILDFQKRWEDMRISSGHDSSMKTFSPHASNGTPRAILHPEGLQGITGCSFDPFATYIIAGGGGLARNIVQWMIKQGARNFVVLSRSGSSFSTSMMPIAELAREDVRMECLPCDISSEIETRAALSKIDRMLPPIKGCIQSALVLRDSVFEKMTYEEWNTPLQARVKGTRNLHSLLPGKMDFFILLSSVVGVMGNPSQANYAASNTYLDAFAHSYSTAETPIISLDIGWVEFAGTVAESEALSSRLANLDCVVPISEPQLMGLLDFYCSPRRDRKEKDCQTLIGLKYPRKQTDASVTGSHILDQPLFSFLRFLNASRTSEYGPSIQHNVEKTEQLSQRLASAVTLSAQAELVVQFFQRKLSLELGVDEEALDLDRSAHDIGVDSLLAVRLRTWFRKEMDANVSVFDIMADISAKELCNRALEKSAMRVKSETSTVTSKHGNGQA